MRKEECGINIRKMRKEKGLTQEELAEKIGVKQGAISQFECGVIQPSVNTLVKIANVLDCSVDDLIAPDESG